MEDSSVLCNAVVAYVCRDLFGRIRDGFAKNIEVSSAENIELSSAKQAEAVALVETLDFISSKLSPSSMKKEFLLQSDYCTLVESVLSLAPLSWAVQPLLDKAKHKMANISGLL